MELDQILQWAQQLAAGQLDLEQFEGRVKAGLPGLAKLGEDPYHQAVLDLDRKRRCGYPEVIYGPGKSPDLIARLAQRLLEAGQSVLVTRLAPETAADVQPRLPQATYHPIARTLRQAADPHQPDLGRAAVVTAGSSDAAVGAEALETLRWMHVQVDWVQDVRVAGPQRLLERLPLLRQSDALVVAAGMEGALPSVVGGHVAAPIVAVPTSVGYGANLGGLSALLAMLNSCAANVAVVNIDAGFKAGFLAGMIARGSARPASSSRDETPP